MIGREKDLLLLDTLHASDSFEFLVLYGRRRTGKTTLLKEFAKTHPVLFYSAQIKNDSMNLSDFSHTVQRYFTGTAFGSFSDWKAAFDFITSQLSDKRITLIIDEFPYIAETNESIVSRLQHTIDHAWKDKNIFVILCGSSVSFMESKVMGSKSPLYGRATSNLELLGFDYLTSSLFFPDYSYEEKLLAYGILGGIPCYLERFKDTSSIARNISLHILRTGSFLKDETQNLLKMELRELGVYNSIFEAIASGASRLNEIAQSIHEDTTKCSKYIQTLKRMRLIEKRTPSGDKPSSRRSLYQITDNFFLFWYHFVFSNASYYELLGEDESAQEIVTALPSYMGYVFKQICMEYLKLRAKNRTLPFVPAQIGRWWGTNPKTRKQDDIDILAIDSTGNSALFCECKYRNRPFGMDEYRNFFQATEIFTRYTQRYYYLFSKSGFTAQVEKRAREEGVRLVNLADLFTP